jgi:hypothetical protein
MLSPHSPPDRTAPGHDDHADDSVYPSTISFLLVHLACFAVDRRFTVDFKPFTCSST